MAANSSISPESASLPGSIRLVVRFGGVRESGHDCRRDNHTYESKTNQKIVHFGCSFCGRRLDPPGLNHKVIMTHVMKNLNTTILLAWVRTVLPLYPTKGSHPSLLSSWMRASASAIGSNRADVANSFSREAVHEGSSQSKKCLVTNHQQGSLSKAPLPQEGLQLIFKAIGAGL